MKIWLVANKLTLKIEKTKFMLFKGWVHCFSKQVVMNKCFLLNPEKKFGTDSS